MAHVLRQWRLVAAPWCLRLFGMSNLTSRWQCGVHDAGKASGGWPSPKKLLSGGSVSMSPLIQRSLVLYARPPRTGVDIGRIPPA